MPQGSTSFATFQRSNDSQTSSEIERTHDRLKRAETATRPGQSVLNSRNKPYLPAKLVREEPDELRRIETLPQAATAFGYNKPDVTRELADFIDRRQKDSEYVDREQWIAKRFDLTQPEKAAWFRGIMPSFLERRRRFGEAKLSMQKQLFDITLFGPQTEEDVDFMFAVDSGKIDMEELKRPIWEAPKNPTDDVGYKKGMFARNSDLKTARAANPNQGWDRSLGIGTDMTPQFMTGTAGRFPSGTAMSGDQTWQSATGTAPFTL